MTAIPPVPLVTVTPRPLNSRLWALHRKTIARTITEDEAAELGALCDRLEREGSSQQEKLHADD